MDIIAYYIATAVLYALTFICSAVLFLCTVCNVRKRQDPARKAFPWLKAAIILFALPCLFTTVYVILQIVSYYRAYYDFNASYVLSCLAELTFDFAEILVFITLMRLASGVLSVQNNHTYKSEGFLRGATYAVAGILAPISIAEFGLNVSYLDTYNPNNSLSAYRLDTASRAIIFVASLVSLARSIQVAHSCRPQSRVAQAPGLLIAAAILFLTRTLYKVISIATIEKVVVVTGSYYSTLRSPNFRIYHMILAYVFSILPLFVLFCLLYVIGARKENGLWSTPQQPMVFNAGNQQPVWGYNYAVAGNNGPNMLPTSLPAQGVWPAGQQPNFQPQMQHQMQMPPQQQYVPVQKQDDPVTVMQPVAMPPQLGNNNVQST